MTTGNSHFLGTGWAFPPTFRKSLRSVDLLQGEEDILSSLHILVHTALGERIMRPDYGTPLHAMLMEPMDQTLRSYVSLRLRDAITLHEPRIVVEDLTVSEVPLEGRLDIHITFSIPAINSQRNLVIPYHLSDSSSI